MTVIISKHKNLDKKKTKIHSIAKLKIKRMRTRNMAKNPTNHMNQNIAKKIPKISQKKTL